ncbi:prostatic acid phosphatase-like [Sitodiplosis mosellana]|uniref:prostatic acid phosphatase-like n=1 Tax=Sitodiplosis mosellana TaxID=263140 RepID=UPI002443C9A9|nr:prostatic acid phosphatase-like [Sitodiplosis mosellana]
MFKLNAMVCMLLVPLVELVPSKDVNSDDELIFVHTVCRHGDRNIYESYPNDPWKATEFRKGGYAQLTNEGKQQHYQLGQYLRKRYSSLLGNGDYSSDKVYVRSTDSDRTLMSSQACLAGLFPPTNDQMWNPNLEWQPIPVHTTPLSNDFLLASDRKCNHFDYIMLEYLNSTEYKSLFKKYKNVIRYLEKMSGKQLRTLTDINNLYDTLLVEQMKGKCIPDWAVRAMKPCGDLEYLAIFWFKIFTVTDEMKKLKSGFLLKEILNRFTNKTQSILSPNRLYLYFAHDITISNMLNTLGLFKLHQPPYASCIFFELYKSNGNPYVQIFYMNSAELEHIWNHPLEIPNCGTKCSLTDLYELYHDVLPTQSFEEEFVLRDGEILPPDGNPENNSL